MTAHRSTDTLPILLLSDATGTTVMSTVRAVLSQYPAVTPDLQLHPFIRRTQDLDAIPDTAFASAAVILYTLVDPPLAARVRQRADAAGTPCLPLLDPLTTLLGRIIGQSPAGRPGGQYSVDQSYLNQIAAIDFAISHDDGESVDKLLSADVILTGVSRTSKTPTCIYLGYQGIKAANVPLVPGREDYPGLEEAIRAGIPVFGLTASPNRLLQIRRTRLQALGAQHHPHYSEPDKIEEELVQARLYFDRFDLPVIDVTRRSIEETAAEIRRMIRGREGEA